MPKTYTKTKATHASELEIQKQLLGAERAENQSFWITGE